jgi:hypothetical protein
LDCKRIRGFVAGYGLIWINVVCGGVRGAVFFQGGLSLYLTNGLETVSPAYSTWRAIGRTKVDGRMAQIKSWGPQ